MLKLYNTLTRKKEIFKPIKKGKVGIYGCGPTVYWYQHIGNMRRYVFEDILIRTLLFNDYKVKHVINVTDVGHLTSDADEGEDKMVKAIKREGLELNKNSMLKIADKYTKVFKEDLKKLNIIEPDFWPKATEHIKEQIELIKRLEEKGYTYKTSVGLIFDTEKFGFGEYSKFGKLNIEELEGGKRVKEDPERRNKSDFALWITNQPNHIMQWDSPWGNGFPGWHLECSAMSMKYLGKQFDIHTGGEEHIPIHHTNEIAQSEAVTGKKPWVRYWLHMRWLLVKDDKMSKSLGNVYRLDDLEKKGFSPMSFRYLCLLTHYRKQLNFTWKHLESAKKSLERMKNIVSNLKKSSQKTNKKNVEMATKQFTEFLNDDLNTPRALSYLWEILRDDRLNDAEKYELALEFDKVFGLDLDKEEDVEIPAEIQKLVDEREKARKEKDWNKADELRKEIQKKGFLVEDGERGSEVKRG
ncbi:MAG: cysteine--tRNA ligase [archaeon]